MIPRRGMTLIEMVIVIAVIATMAAILFPVFARARERARCQSCLSNLVNIGLALQLYAADHDGLYPPTEDDLSPLRARYLRQDQVFVCPSDRGGVPMGAPADPGPYEEDEARVATSYYYRAGHTRDDAPSAPIVSDHRPDHSEHANVLYSDGHARRLAEQEWRGAGFQPIEEIWPPEEAATDRASTGMGRGGQPTMGGGGTP